MILLDKRHLEWQVQGLEPSGGEDIIKKVLWTRILNYRGLVTILLSGPVDG